MLRRCFNSRVISSLLRKGKSLPLAWKFLALLFLCVLLFAPIFFMSGNRSAHAAIDNPSAPPSMGINLNNVGDSGSDFLFADAFKTWRLEPPPGQSNAPSLDANGWPQGDFGAFLWDGSYIQNITGTYALSFTGQATLGLSLANGQIQNQSYNAGTNTTTATVVISQQSSAQLNFTNTKRNAGDAPGDGVTNVQLMRPTSPGASSSYAFGTTFTDQIKQLVTRFAAIRFMDYTSTNSNGQVNWSDRRLPQENQEGPAHNSNSYGWEGLGGAWEYAIQLCNETNRDCYINIPELATGSSPSDTSSYIYHLAQLFKYGSDANGNVYTSTQSNPVHAPLKSSLHLYVEYSNEVWNTGGAFAQSGQNHDAAKAEVAAGDSPLNYDGDTNDWNWAWRRQAKRIKETSEIFRAVFGNSAMMTQVRPLLEWQMGNGQATAQSELSFLYNYYDNGDGNHVSSPEPVNYYLWGGGGAAYSGVNNPNASTIDDIYNSGIDTASFYQSVATDVNFARAFGLHDVAYEGGFNIGGDAPTSLQIQANLDSRATGDEEAFQNAFNQAGGDLLMYFNSSGKSAYGLASPDVFSQNTPKLQAIAALSQNNQAAFTNGTSMPGSIDGNNWSVNSRGWGTPGSGSLGTFGFQPDQYGTQPVKFASYSIRNAAGNYTITVNYSSTVSAGLLIYAGGTYLETATISSGSQQNTSAASVSLPVGLNAVFIAAMPGSADFTINSITVAAGGGGGGGTLLAGESFNYASGALNGQNGGSGWSGAWTTQNGDASVPGYNVVTSSPLSYSNLQTAANHATGGASYLTTGRSLNVSGSGPFSAYLSNGQIGAAGKTLWVSLLLRKDANNEQTNAIYLHNNAIPWCTNCASSVFGAGYFGSGSDANGTRYWSLDINGTIYRSNVVVTVGQTALLSLQINFGSTTTVSLYVNPASLGGSAPASASAQATGSNLVFQSMAYYGGDGAAQSSLDEIRFGTSYAAVTPTA